MCVKKVTHSVVYHRKCPDEGDLSFPDRRDSTPTGRLRNAKTRSGEAPGQGRCLFDIRRWRTPSRCRAISS